MFNISRYSYIFCAKFVFLIGRRRSSAVHGGRYDTEYVTSEYMLQATGVVEKM